MGAISTLLFAFVLLAAIVGVFVWATRRIRKGGGGATVGVLGAAYELLSSDQRRAAETIIQRNAGESEEEEPSSDPSNRDEDCIGDGDEARPAAQLACAADELGRHGVWTGDAASRQPAPPAPP